MKRLLQLLLAVMLVLNFTVVLGEDNINTDGNIISEQYEYTEADEAETEDAGVLGAGIDLPLYRDMTESIDGKTPNGFTSSFLGIGPKLSVVNGYAGKRTDDVSSVITSGEGVAVARTPYVYIRPNAAVEQGKKITIAFKIAAGDYNADKAVYFRTNTSSVKTSPELAFTMKNGDENKAEIYAFGEKIADNYLLGRWYNVELVLSGGTNTFDCYLDGEKVVNGAVYKPNENSDDMLTQISDVYYGLRNKNDVQNSAEIYFDDLYINYEDVTDESKVEVVSERYTVDSELMIISDFDNTTVAEFKTGFDLKNNEKISVISPDGESITDENTEMASGMIVEFSSANGRNTIYYKLFNLKISLIQPADKTYVRPGEPLTVEADTLGTGSRVVFFAEKDGTIIQQEKTLQPYLVEFEGLENGVYSVYAEVHDVAGNVLKSDIVTVTVTENLAPLVSFSSLKSGSFEYTDKIADSVIVADNDGTVEKVEIYADGKLIKTADRENGEFKPIEQKNNSDEAEAESALKESVNEKGEMVEFTITDVPMGMCTIEAVAYDNEYKAGKAAAELDIAKTQNVVFYSNTFEENASGWSVGNPGNAKGYGIMLAPGGNAYGITVPANGVSNAAPLFTTSSLNSYYMSGVTTTEFDICVTSTLGLNLKSSIKDGTKFTDVMLIKDDKAGDATLMPGEWHHFVYNIDYQGKTYSVFLGNEKVSEGALTDNSGMADIRFTMWATKEDDITIYFKNYKISGVISETKVNSIETYNESDKLDIIENKVNSLSNTVQLNFNNSLLAETVTTENVLVYADGKQVGNYGVNIGKQSELGSSAKTASAVTLTFDEPLKSNAVYTVVLTKNIKLSDKKAITAKILYKFITEPKECDITEWKLTGNTREINFKGELRGGETVKLSAVFTNSTGETQNGKFIFAVYDGERLVDIKIADVTAGIGGETVSEGIVLPQSLENVKIHGYIWDDFDNINSVSKNYVMDFTAE